MGFFERSNMPQPDGFPLLGVRHILLLLTLAGCIAAGLRSIRRQPPQKAQRMLDGAAILVPVLELSHSVWLYLTGTHSLIKLLPLHLCGLQSLFIPLAVFTKFTCFRDFVYATSLLGGIFGTVLPSGVAECYPIWSFQTLQTFALHGLLIFVPLAMILCGMHQPSIHRFPRVLCIFLLAALAVGLVDQMFGENYMFLYAPPAGTPLVWIFNTFGRGVYLACTFVLLSGASLLVHLPFRGSAAQAASDDGTAAPILPHPAHRSRLWHRS